MIRVAVSPGHNASKVGACHEGFCEYPETESWRDVLAVALAAKGIEVFKVNPAGLTAKVASINAMDCAMAIEVHFNACGGCGASGTETLYYPGSVKGKAAAELVHVRLHAAMGNKDRGVKEGWYKMDRPGVVDFYGDEDGDEMPDYFLRKTNCTALIVEPEFVEYSERIQAKRGEACKAMAEGIVDALAALGHNI